MCVFPKIYTLCLGYKLAKMAHPSSVNVMDLRVGVAVLNMAFSVQKTSGGKQVIVTKGPACRI